MGGRSRNHLRRWLCIALALVMLAVSCGTSSAQEDPLAAARIASSSAGGSSSPSSVRIEIPAAADAEPPPSIEITQPPGTQPSSAVVPSTAPRTTAPRPTAARDPRQHSPYSIVAQATVPALVARSSPSADGAVIADFTNPTSSGSPLVFQAVDGAASTSDWMEVHLPIQPNGSTGWIPRQDVELTNNPYRLRIDRASYSLQVFHLNELWLEAPVAIGTGATPTPVGDFYLLELLRPLKKNGPYGPFAFGLSGFSEVLESFGGADTAIIGIHGTNDPSSIGTEVSHGCVRLDNAVIEQLAATLPLGTPVTIT